MIPEPDSARYSEAIDQQWALARDMMTPGRYWLAGVDRENVSQLRAQGRDARDLAGFVAAHIARAEPFFWSAGIARAIVQAAQTLPTYTYTAESFPCAKGFVWFEQPIQLQTELPDLARLTALAWSVLAHRDDPDGVPVLVYAFAAAEPRWAGVPMLQGTLRLGSTVEQHLARRATQVVEEPGMGSAAERLAVNASFHRFFAGCLSFLEQRIVRAVDRPISRAARRRLQREQPDVIQASTVKVIELRRRESDPTGPDDGDAGGVTVWRWQWVVSGHWRRQYYPRSNAHKPRYIAPYVKGPPDKPLKAPTGTVIAVRR